MDTVADRLDTLEADYNDLASALENTVDSQTEIGPVVGRLEELEAPNLTERIEVLGHLMDLVNEINEESSSGPW